MPSGPPHRTAPFLTPQSLAGGVTTTPQPDPSPSFLMSGVFA
jgi:hypothetical protein